MALRWSTGHALEVTTSADLALLVAHDVGEALADLHGVGLAHGDVKPANIVLSDGRASLIDLGLAGPSRRSDVGGATPRYLARGDRQLGDARARDLLALGIVLGELSTSKVAASSEPLAAARAAAIPAPIGPI